MCRLGESGTRMKSSSPSRLNACPNMPGANVAPFCGVPWFPSPEESTAFPSACQYATKPSVGTVSIIEGGSPSSVTLTWKVVSAVPPLPSSAFTVMVAMPSVTGVTVSTLSDTAAAATASAELLAE